MIPRRPQAESSLARAGRQRGGSGVKRIHNHNATGNDAFVNPDATYQLACCPFFVYTHQKYQRTPQLPVLSEEFLGWLLREMMHVSRS